jgi:hypothetical protein
MLEENAVLRKNNTNNEASLRQWENQAVAQKEQVMLASLHISELGILYDNMTILLYYHIALKDPPPFKLRDV